MDKPIDILISTPTGSAEKSLFVILDQYGINQVGYLHKKTEKIYLT